jgi:hypothetical protein
MSEFPLTGAPADWRETEPQKTLIDAMEALQERGYSADDVNEASLVVTLTLSNRLHGPGAVAARLLKLAKLFSAQAGHHITVTTDRATH